MNGTKGTQNSLKQDSQLNVQPVQRVQYRSNIVTPIGVSMVRQAHFVQAVDSAERPGVVFQCRGHCHNLSVT